MATKKSLKQEGYDPTAEITKRSAEIAQELEGIDQQLATLDKEESAPRELQLTPRSRQKIARDRERLTKQRITLEDERKELVKKRPMSYDLWERDYNPDNPQPMPEEMWKYASGGEGPGAETGEGKMATTEKAKPGAGGRLDIEMLPGGGFKSGGPISASQMAILMPEMFGASPEALKRATAQQPPGEKPPTGYQPTDYSIEGRRRFEQQVLGQVGFNPITFDPNEFLAQSMQDLPALFNHVFRGKVLWADRDKLSKNEMDFWTNTVKQFRADVWQKAQTKQAQGTKLYNFMMNRFDKEAALKEKALTEFRKAPTTKNLWSPEKKAKTVWQWDPDKGDWIDTGKLAEEPKKKGMPQEVKDAWGFVKTLMGSYGGGIDIGEPGRGPELSAKAQQIMQILGKAPLDKRVKKLYEDQLKIILDYFGIREVTSGVSPGSTPSGKTPVEGESTKTYKDKEGKSWDITAIPG